MSPLVCAVAQDLYAVFELKKYDPTCYYNII